MNRSTGTLLLLGVLAGCSSVDEKADLRCQACCDGVLKPPPVSRTLWQPEKPATAPTVVAADTRRTPLFGPQAVTAAKPAALPAVPPAPAKAPVPTILTGNTNTSPTPTPRPAARPAAPMLPPPSPPMPPPPPVPVTQTAHAPVTMPPLLPPAPRPQPALELPPPAVDANQARFVLPPSGPLSAAAPAAPSITLDTSDAPPSPAIRMVNNRRVNLNFEIRDVGPSGVAAVELWWTQDGRNWSKYEGPTQVKPPLTVEVTEEGLYGFTLVAKSGVGLGKAPPKSGDLPQVWVEVDLTAPAAQLLDAEPGRGARAHEVLLRWSLTDKNLGPKPVALTYAERPEGPWLPIAANVENTGRYVWHVLPTVPRRLYLRLEAYDLVGNRAVAQSDKPVIIDLSQPTVSIISVEPGGK